VQISQEKKQTETGEMSFGRHDIRTNSPLSSARMRAAKTRMSTWVINFCFGKKDDESILQSSMCATEPTMTQLLHQQQQQRLSASRQQSSVESDDTDGRIGLIAHALSEALEADTGMKLVGCVFRKKSKYVNLFNPI